MKTKYLIIGAGISGLSFANYCKGDYLIVEKENEVGGFCRTIKRSGYVWDYAGHFFHFKTDELRDTFIREIPKKDIIYNNKCTKILYKHKLIDFPFQMNIHQLEKDEFIDCLYDLFNKTEKKKYDNFLDMLYGKFGKSIVEKFLKPYNEKLYSTDLKELDVDAMGRFFPYADKEQIIKNMKANMVDSYNSSFLYPKGGAVTFINVLNNKLDKNRVLLNSEIKSIDTEAKLALLYSGDTIKYDFLINTIPLNRFLKLIGKGESILKEMSYNKVLVFNMGFDKKSPNYSQEHWLYIPSKESNYYRLGFYNNILGEERLSIYVEIGYKMNATIDKKEIQRQLKLTLKNLIKDGVIDKKMKLVDYEPIIMDPAYVHISTKVSKRIEKLAKQLEKNSVYTIGRYGAWIYNCMEDSVLTAKDLAKKI